MPAAQLYRTPGGWSTTPDRIAPQPGGSAYDLMRAQEARYAQDDQALRAYEAQQREAQQQHLARRSQRNAAVQFDLENMDRELSYFGNDRQALAATDPIRYQRALELEARRRALIAQQQQEDTGDDRELAVAKATPFSPGMYGRPASAAAPSRVSTAPSTGDDPYTTLQRQEAAHGANDQAYRAYEQDQQQMAEQMRAQKSRRAAATQFDLDQGDRELQGQASQPDFAMRQAAWNARRRSLTDEQQMGDQADERQLAIRRATPFRPVAY